MNALPPVVVIMGVYIAVLVAAILVIWLWYKWSVSRSLGEHIGAWWKGLKDAQKGAVYILCIVLAAVLYNSHGAKKTKPEYDRVKKTWSFGDYKCLDDCSGHVAGYEWALEQGIDDEKDCQGRARSFIEGCKVAAAEAEEARREQQEYDPSNG